MRQDNNVCSLLTRIFKKTGQMMRLLKDVDDKKAKEGQYHPYIDG